MIGFITLVILLASQVGFLVYQLITKNRQTKSGHILRISFFTIFSLLLIFNVYWWGFRWIGLFILLLISAILSAIYFIRKNRNEKQFKKLKLILTCISSCILITFSTLPGIIFPQFKEIAPTGPYKTADNSITFIDNSQTDPYSDKNENRRLTVQFWYPNSENKGKFPLVVFSHGSFGFRGSNLSTFENLASNGYVVCSIDHSYHSFMSKHTDGSSTLVNMDFLNDATNIENNVYDEQTTYNKTAQWLNLRAKDMDFVLDKIFSNIENNNSEKVYSLINTEKIGLFGHSLGGATAAQLGRSRSDIDSVIVIDGTMIGEQQGFENGKRIFNKQPYPVPILNMYNDSHYSNANKLGMDYNNFFASKNAVEAYDVMIRNSGHLNFTDLPMFSPTLAKMLGTGSVNSRYCIETMNKITLEFFNYTLKDAKKPELKTKY